jgi:hypothetical protein
MSSSINSLSIELIKLAHDYGDLSRKEALGKNPLKADREKLQKRVEELIHRPGIHFSMLSSEQYQGLFDGLLIVNKLAFDDEAIATNQPSKIIHFLAQKHLGVGALQEPKIKSQIRDLLKANDAVGLEKFLSAADLSDLSTKDLYLLLNAIKAKFAVHQDLKKVFIWIVNNALTKKPFDPSVDWDKLLKDIDIDLKHLSPLILHDTLKAINDRNGVIAPDRIKYLNDYQLGLIFQKYFAAFVNHAKEQIKKDSEDNPKAFREFFDQLFNHPHLGPHCAQAFTDFITNEQNAKKISETMAAGGLGLLASIANSRIVRHLTRAQFQKIIELPLRTGKSPLADNEGIGTLTIFCTNYFKYGKEGKAAFHDFLKAAVVDVAGSKKPHLRSLIDYAVNTPFFKEYLDEQQVKALVLELFKQLELSAKGQIAFIQENLKHLLNHPQVNFRNILKDLIDNNKYTMRIGKELSLLLSQKELSELQSIMKMHEGSLKMREIHGAG